MAVTKAGFRGGGPIEQRQDWNGDCYPPAPGSSSQDLIVNMVGAKAQQSGVSKGADDGMTGPGNDADDPRRLFDFRKNPIELLLGAHQRIDMLNRQHLGILSGCCACHCCQCLPGCVRHEVKVEIAVCAVRHGLGE